RSPPATPAAAAAHADRARTLAAQDPSNAQAEATMAVRAAPWVGEYHFLQGQLLAKAGAYEGALRAFTLYLEIAPNARDRAVVEKLIAGLRRQGTSKTAGLARGETFRDCPRCPEMVVLPA